MYLFVFYHYVIVYHYVIIIFLSHHMKYIILLQQDNHNGIIIVFDTIPIRGISIHSFKCVISKWTNNDRIQLFQKKRRQKHHAQNFICTTYFVYHIHIWMMRSENIYLSFFIEYCTSNKANINIDWLGITTIAITFIIDKHINNYVIGWNLSINNWHHPYEILIQIKN